jgi:class 3 adenylate cyclase
MPLFMDRHDLAGMTAEEVAGAHLKDLEVQDRFGVQFLTYWFDDDRQTAFCLARAQTSAAVEAAHGESHGLVGTQIFEVDQGAVERFMGGIVSHSPGEPYVETAFRSILFTDIEDSTGITGRLGDARAMDALRHHDQVVRDALNGSGGSEVKHTGDGIMASFQSVTAAIRSAIDIQQRVAERDVDGVGLRIRIGISAGEPVTEQGDLFGATVQLAARLCQRATPGGILVSSGVHGLALGKGFTFAKARRLRLKGFDEPQLAYEVIWRPRQGGR